MRRKIVACVTLSVALLSGCATPERSSSPPAETQTTVGIVVPPLRPLPSVTPGAILTGDVRDVCRAGWAKNHRRSLSATEKRSLLAAYRLSGSVVTEWDHLIPLELGGDNGARNVWPETVGSARKNAYENVLHADVCHGRIPLAEAQQRIRQFWKFY